MLNMKNSDVKKIILVLILAIAIGISLSTEIVSTEEVDIQTSYGTSPLTPVMPATAILTYDIEELNRSVRLIDGRVLKNDNYFWVEVIDTETGSLLAEHRLELPHEYDGDIGDLTEVMFSKDKRRAVISEIKDPLRLSIPGAAYTYILNTEDGSLALISAERTWKNTWIDSSGEYLILVNIGDKYPPRGEAVTSYLRVYNLEDGESTDNIAVSDEVDSTKDKNGFVGASYDGIEATIKITRERLHWLTNEMERWNIYYRIGENGSISCIEDEMDCANQAKTDVEANVKDIEPDPKNGSKLRFISKNDKENGGYDVILDYYSDEYAVSYNFNNKLISIALPDGTVIIPKDEPEISIELNESNWSLKLGLGGKADNLKYDAYGSVPAHQIKNTGTIPIDIDIGYKEITGCKAGFEPAIDTFAVKSGYTSIPSEGRIIIEKDVASGEVRGIPLEYYAPTQLSIDTSSMSAVFEIRAYASEQK
jgi:hypothetical protein